jgi:GTP pyrophosphokinase
MHLDKNENIFPTKYDNLLRSCKNSLGNDDLLIIQKAYELAVEVYADQQEESGVPYISHALDVALIVSEEIGLSTVSIVSALLHDILKSSAYKESDLEHLFGQQICKIVVSLTKIAGLSIERTTVNTDNFIKFLVTMSGDVHVILIKLADRLYYMRNIDRLPVDIQKKIAAEASQLYSPITHRLGLYNIKTELEERALKCIYPEIYYSLERKLEETTSVREAFINSFIKPIEKELSRQGLKCEIKGRSKSISSIWSKMKKQNVDFEEVYDLFAVRVISEQIMEDEKSDCWKIYSIVTNIYQPNPKRLRDWITTPKASGYESLHTTVIGPEGRWVEVQIRTRRMDEIAEHGGAAHWRYKESVFGLNNDEWTTSIRKKIEEPLSDHPAYPDSSKIELYSHDIFIFTPAGDLKKLPAGSTVLDFAYQIHTSIGNTCTGAKVNKTFVTLKHVLKNGDQVEVLTSKSQKPNSEWLNFVVSARSKAKIKRALNEQTYYDASTGRDILIRKLNQLKLTLSNETINTLLEYFKLDNPLELYHKVANGSIDISEVRTCFESTTQTVHEIRQHETGTISLPIAPRIPASEELLVIDGDADLKDYRFARCCHPVYGDNVFGFITVGKGIKIHRTDCPNADQMRSRYSYRIIKAKWLSDSDATPHLASLKIIGRDELGLINKISDLISVQLKLNLRSVSFETKGNKFEGSIRVYVQDARQLDFLIRRLMKVKAVEKVVRAI